MAAVWLRSMTCTQRQRSLDARAPKDPVYIAGSRRTMRLRAVVDARWISPEVGTKPQGELAKTAQPLHNGLLVHQRLLCIRSLRAQMPSPPTKPPVDARARRARVPFACQQSLQLTVTSFILARCDGGSSRDVTF